MSYSKRFTITPETTLNVSISGTPNKNPTLIFLHFWGGSSATFSSTISALSPDFHSIAVDLRGWGTSIGPQDPAAYSIRAMAEDIEALIPQLKVKDYILVGHSMGGKIAQLIAGRIYIPGLKGVILIAPAPPTPLRLPPGMEQQQLAAYSTPESAEFVVRNVLSASALPDEVVRRLVDDMTGGNEFAKKAWPVYGMGEDIVEEARRIKVPVVVIAGKKDRVETLERLRAEVLGNIEGAEMVLIDGSGHLIPIEDPSRTAQSVIKFVRETAVS